MQESPFSDIGPQVLASLAIVDQRQPPDWLLMQVLTDLEQTVIVRDRNFEGYLELCSEAWHLVKDPVLGAAFDLGRLNGLRRIPTASVEKIQDEASRLEATLSALDPDSPRANFLRASFGYNMGIFSRDIGQFEAAIQYQRLALKAYLKLDDIIRAAISRFLVAVERFNLALAKGENIEQRLAELDEAYLSEKSTLEPVSWWWINLPAHILLAHTQANQFDGSEAFDDALKIIFALEGPAAEKSVHFHRLALAVVIFLKQGVLMAMSLLKDITNHADRDRQADVTLTACLAIGRWAKQEDPEASNAGYKQIADWTGLKGQQVKALALREMTPAN